MSSEGVETVRAALACLNAGDIDGFISLCDENFDLDMSARVFNPKTYLGHDGIRTFHGDVSEVWEEFRWEPTRFVDASDAVVVLLHSHGRGRGSGIEMARDAAMVWTVREGRALSLRFYVDQAEALKAAGVEQ